MLVDDHAVACQLVALVWHGCALELGHVRALGERVALVTHMGTIVQWVRPFVARIRTVVHTLMSVVHPTCEVHAAREWGVTSMVWFGVGWRNFGPGVVLLPFAVYVR